MRVRIKLQRKLRPYGKDAFVEQLPLGARVFDIGCGNRSPERVKVLRGDLYYVGLDIQDCTQTIRSRELANEYRITSAGHFLAAIEAERATMDAVISSHNLEHCEDPMAVISGMAASLKREGRLYLSFPCEASLEFPSRRGSLRFSDDPTHRTPPSWTHVLTQLSENGMRTDFAAPRYRPWAPAVLGALLEPISALTRRVMPVGSTWALWGFESVIWATKVSP
jgi:SAM-dependent methyltransferase